VRPEARRRWAALGLFLISRVVLLSVNAPDSSLLAVDVTYAFEAQRAAQLGMSLYKVHEINAAEDNLRSSAVERQVEYPPLAILWMTAPTWFIDPLPRTGMAPDSLLAAAKQAERVALFLVDLCGFGLLWWLGVEAAPLAVYAGAGALLFPLLYDRMDLVLGVLLLAAIAARLRKLPEWVWLALLAVAINFKLTPLVIAPAFVLGGSRKEAVRRTAVLGAFTAGIFLPFLIRDGLPTLGFLQYHGVRGLQLEALLSTIPDTMAALFRVPAQVLYRYGSWEVQSAITGGLVVLASIAMVLVIPAAAWTALRVRAPLVHLSVVLLMAGILASKVFSPQYLLWILPLIVMWEGRRRWWVWAGFLTICALTTLCYPIGYTRLMAAVGQAGTLPFGARLAGIAPLVLRNVLLVTLTILCWRDRGQAAQAESIPAVATRSSPAKKRSRAR
jgi:hypothetical protein